MKSSTLTNRSRIAALAISGVLVIGTPSVMHAQYGGGASDQSSSSSHNDTAGSSAGQAKPSDSSGVAGHDVLDKGVESGKVDQRIRVERNKGVEPSAPRRCAGIKKER